MRYRFYTADVFTDRRFGGNQLAVLPDARGLTTEQMLAWTQQVMSGQLSGAPPATPDSHPFGEDL